MTYYFCFTAGHTSHIWGHVIPNRVDRDVGTELI